MRPVTCFLSIVIASSCLGQSSSEIVRRSQDFYQNIPSGHFEIHSKFKSAIAVDTSFDSFTGSLCRIKNQTLIQWESDGWLYINNGNEALNFGEKTNKLWYTKKTDKDAFPNRLIKKMPFFYPEDFFSSLHVKNLTIKRQGEFLVLCRQEPSWLRDVGRDEFWFDTVTYQLRKHIAIVDSKKYGVQYAEDVINFEKNERACNEQIYDTRTVYAYYLSRKDSFATKPESNFFTERDIGKVFPDFTVTSASGRNFSSRELKGNYVLVDLFYQSCEPCVRSIKDINALHDKYVDKGLVVFGVDHLFMDTSNMVVFIKRYDVRYEVVMGQDGFKFWKLVANSAFPTHILLDPEGKIALFSTGTSKKFYKGVEKLLDKYQQPGTN